MALEEYKKKRTFHKTPEPTGGKGAVQQRKETAVVITMKEEQGSDLLSQAKRAEAKQDYAKAEKLYQQQIKKRHGVEFAFNRLMIIYRKQKKYKEELDAINEGIKYFQALYEKKSKESSGGKAKVKQLSTALLKSLGMADKKGNTLYELEPLPTWRKRKLFVEKRLKTKKK